MFKNLDNWQEWLVSDGLVPFTQLLVYKNGKEVYYRDTGKQDIESDVGISRHSVSRIYSMTKPITCVALMILFERGTFQLDDPVHLYLGDKWKKSAMRVLNSEGSSKKKRVYDRCQTSITIKQLLTHTSGISYAFDIFGNTNEVDLIYFEEGLLTQSGNKDIKSFVHHHESLEDFVDMLARMPLMFQPGEYFNYGYNVEVLGRIIEVISGQEYSNFVKDNVLTPLQMSHTGFYPIRDDIENNRVTSLYRHQLNPLGKGLKRKDLKLKKLFPDKSRQWTPEQTFFKPGEGLVSTIDDYMRFALMLRNGGELDGVKVLSKRTIELMASNHLKDSHGLAISVGKKQHPRAFQAPLYGQGFGLGLAIDFDPTARNILCAPGTYYWSGAGSTYFWVDPKEDILVVFFTQVLMPEVKLLPLRNMLVNVVNGCLVNGREDTKQVSKL